MGSTTPRSVGLTRAARSIEAAAVAGLAHSALSLIATWLLLGAPDPASGAGVLDEWYSDPGNQRRMIMGLNLLVMSSIAFLWFVAVIRRRVGDRENRFFGTVFFVALAGAAFLSGIAAFEVLVAGLTDNTGLTRRRATWTMATIVFFLAIPPMINMRIFVPWDLAFGSGAQTAGALAAALAVGWGIKRSEVLKEIQAGDDGFFSPGRLALLYFWIRWVIPGAILAVGAWWLLTDVLGVMTTI